MKRFLSVLLASMFLASAAYAAEGKGDAMKTDGKVQSDSVKTEGKAKGAKKAAEGKAKAEVKSDGKAKADTK